MFENKFNTKKTDPLVEAVMQAQQDGEMRRQAEAIVNEAFGVYNRNAVVREDLAGYDMSVETVYQELKEGTQIDEISKDLAARYSKKAKAQANRILSKHERSGISNAEYDKYYKRKEGAALADAKRKVRVPANEEAELADKDYDKDGKIESPKDEVWGSRLRAAKMAGKLKEGLDIVDTKTGKVLNKPDPSVQGSGDVTKSAPKEDPSTPKSYPGAASTVSGPNPTSQRMSNAKAAINEVSKGAAISAYREKEAQDRDTSKLGGLIKRKWGKETAKHAERAGAQDTVGLVRRGEDRGKEDSIARDQRLGSAARKTKSGKVHKQDTATLKGNIKRRLGSHTKANLPEETLDEAVSRKHFQQVADLIKGHDSQEKRNELASHHAGIFAKQNPRFNAAKFHAAAGSTAHQEPKKMDEAKYSYKSARKGEDIGKPGKMFGKIAKKAGERYGSEERGKKVAGAILAKIRAKHMKEDQSF